MKEILNDWEIKNFKSKTVDQFVRGYIAAISVMIQLEGFATTSIEEAYAAGVGRMTPSALLKCGCDPNDVDRLRPMLKELSRKHRSINRAVKNIRLAENEIENM